MSKLTDLFKGGLTRSYPKGQIILYQGERSHNAYLVVEGYVKIYDIDAQGNEKLIMILGPDDIFPVVWAFDAVEPIHYFYETYSETTLNSIERELMVNAIETEFEVAKSLLRYFVTRTKQMLSRIECIEATSAFHKVAQVLSYLAEAHGTKTKAGIYTVNFPVTHQSIANMAGITRETASLQLKEIEQRKALDSGRNNLVIHTSLLHDLIQGD